MRRFISLLGAFLFLSLQWHPLPSQLRQSEAFFPWEYVGPSNLGHTLIAGVKMGNSIFVGSPFGGLFRSTDEGRNWELVRGFCLNDNMEPVYRTLSVTALAAEGNSLYVGTGAIQQYNPAAISLSAVSTTKGGVVGAFGPPGMGVFVSTDGGNTFSNQNATWKLSYPAISYTRDYENVGIINVQGISISQGRIAILTPDTLFISTDNLATLQGTGRLAGGRRLRSVAWGAGNTLFVTTNDSLYRSIDGGQTFTRSTEIVLPPGASGVSGIGGGNVVVCSAPSDPSIIYLASAKSNGELVGVWVSSDNGENWVRIANAENASFQVLNGIGTASIVLKVDPQDPTRIVIGGSQLWEFSPARGWQRFSPTNLSLQELPTVIRDVVFLDGGELLVIGDGFPVRLTRGGTRIEDASRGIQATRILSLAVSPLGDVHASGPSPILITSHYVDDPPGLFRIVNLLTTVFDAVRNPVGNVGVSSINPEVVFFSYQDGRLRVAIDRGQGYSSFYAVPHRSSWDTALIQPGSTGREPPPWIAQDRPEKYGPLYPPFALLEKYESLVKTREGKRRGTSHLFIATGQGVWTITNPISTSLDSIAHWNRVSRNIPIGINASHTYSSYVSPSNAIPTA
ncbi:MAG: hypothetical protein RMJ66_07310, partial [Bacteroidia bacterium]|nr:hypothetical protein [Bacteroidia bacterium]MDW8134861.1 hypothetical protein [Bacteroidia bacterium]